MRGVAGNGAVDDTAGNNVVAPRWPSGRSLSGRSLSGRWLAGRWLSGRWLPSWSPAGRSLSGRSLSGRACPARRAGRCPQAMGFARRQQHDVIDGAEHCAMVVGLHRARRAGPVRIAPGCARFPVVDRGRHPTGPTDSGGRRSRPRRPRRPQAGLPTPARRAAVGRPLRCPRPGRRAPRPGWDRSPRTARSAVRLPGSRRHPGSPALGSPTGKPAGLSTSTWVPPGLSVQANDDTTTAVPSTPCAAIGVGCACELNNEPTATTVTINVPRTIVDTETRR